MTVFGVHMQLQNVSFRAQRSGDPESSMTVPDRIPAGACARAGGGGNDGCSSQQQLPV